MLNDFPWNQWRRQKIFCISERYRASYTVVTQFM
jgi:hypothetical protein